MILLHTVLVLSVLSPILSTIHNNENALSRLHEARARALSNRARAREHSSRLLNRLRASNSSPSTSRAKRQQYLPVYGGVYPPQPLPPLPPPPSQNFIYEDEEPELVHICSAEEDEEESGYDQWIRSADSGETDFPRRKNEHSLEQALDDLKEVKEILDSENKRHSQPEHEHKENREAEALFSPYFANLDPQKIIEKGISPPPQNNIVTPGFHFPQAHFVTPGLHITHGISQLNSQLQNHPQQPSSIATPNSVTPQGNREAHAHIHSHSKIHSHQKIHSHGNAFPFHETKIVTPGLHVPQTLVTPGLHVPQSHITSGLHVPQTHITSGLHVPQTHITSGLHVPQTHITQGYPHLPHTQIHTPGVNFNFNQNQGLHSGLHSYGSIPTSSTIGTVIPTHTQPILHARSSGDIDADNKPTENINENSDPENVDGNKNIVGGVPRGEEREASPTHKLKEKLKPKYYPQYPSYNNYQYHGQEKLQPKYYPQYPAYNNYQYHGKPSGPYREEEEEDDDDDTENQDTSLELELREADPTLKKLKKKLKNQQYYQQYPAPHQQYYQHYPAPNPYHYRARDAEDDLEVVLEDREATPSKKLKPKFSPQYGQLYREAGATEETVGEPHLEELLEKLKPEHHEPYDYPTYPHHYPQPYPHHNPEPYPHHYPEPYSHPQDYDLYRDANEDNKQSALEDISKSGIVGESQPLLEKSEESKGKLMTQESDDEVVQEPSPTLKKLKKKLEEYPAYPPYPQYYGRPYGSPYREANQDFLEDNEIREAFGPFKETDEDFPEDGKAREADPTLKKLKKLKQMPHYYQAPSYNARPQHYGPYRDASEEADSTNERISSPFLFNVPARRYNDQYKRSVSDELDSVLGIQHEIVDSLKEKSKDDEDLKLVTDIGDRTLTNVEEQKTKIVRKRSIPLVRLIHDPHAKLDIPKTIENFGTATKNAFEDERAPMYHVKNLVGHSKNAILSAMKIPPQNMIIPSDYEIMRTSGRSRSNPEDEYFDNTFRKVGEMVRESVKSGQDTVSHLGDIAHSARNVIHSARHSAPRLLIPYAQVPALQDSPRRRSKVALITPRIAEVGHDHGENHKSRDIVRLSHLMDAVGMSNPNSKNLHLHKIVFEPHKITEIPVNERLAEMYSKFRHRYDDDVETVTEAISTLEDAKISVGAKNLRDFLIKMRGQLTDMVRSTPDKHKKKKYKSKSMKQQETKEMGKFIENLFDGKKESSKNEIVGERIHLSPELMHPFMGRASENDVKNFLDDNTVLKTPKSHFDKAHGDDHNNSDLGYVLGAINPLMFERLYNETVTTRRTETPNPEDFFQENPEAQENATVGTYFALNEPMLKPFMGQVPERQVETFLDSYNKDEATGYEQMDD